MRIIAIFAALALAAIIANTPTTIATAEAKPPQTEVKQKPVGQSFQAEATYYHPENPETAFGKKPAGHIVATNHFEGKNALLPGSKVIIEGIVENGRKKPLKTPIVRWIGDKTGRKHWKEKTHRLDFCEPTSPPRSHIKALSSQTIYGRYYPPQ